MAGFNLSSLAIIGVGVVVITSVGLLLSQKTFWSILWLAGQYAGVFILMMSEWPLPFALTKLVAGWIAAAVLWMGIVSSRKEEMDPQSQTHAGISLPQMEMSYANSGSAILFRLIAAILVIMTMFSLSPKVVGWVPGITFETTLGALVLIGIGLLHLGLTTHPLRVIFGLLTLLSGFEILYAAVEVSALVGGLLAAVTMGLALLGAYFFLSTGAEETE